MDVQILQADVPNKNGRIYPTEMIEKMIREVGDRPIFGHVGLPDGTSIDLVNVSHQVTGLRMENGNLVGTVKILDTPMGQYLKAILLAEARDYRMSGTGFVSVDGEVSDYTLISIDAVQDGA